MATIVIFNQNTLGTELCNAQEEEEEDTLVLVIFETMSTS